MTFEHIFTGSYRVRVFVWVEVIDCQEDDIERARQHSAQGARVDYLTAFSQDNLLS